MANRKRGSGHTHGTTCETKFADGQTRSQTIRALKSQAVHILGTKKKKIGLFSLLPLLFFYIKKK